MSDPSHDLSDPYPGDDSGKIIVTTRGTTTRMACKTVGKTLRQISSTYRTKIKRLYRAKCSATRLDETRRALLSECVFEIENDLEHRLPTHPQVKVMRAVRNLLYDDLGWNEYQTARINAKTAKADLTP